MKVACLHRFRWKSLSGPAGTGLGLCKTAARAARTRPTRWWSTLHCQWRDAVGLPKLRMTVAGVAALMLGIGVITLVLVQRAERDMLADQRELQEAVRTASVLSSRGLELQRAEQLDEGTLRDAAALDRFFHDRVVLRHMFSHVIAATSDGEVRAYADRNGVRPMPINVADRAYFRQTLAEERPVISEVLPSRAVHEPVLVLTQPLRDSRGVFGVINGTLWLRSGEMMAPMVPHQGGSDPDALLVVSDAQGRIQWLASRDPLTALANRTTLEEQLAQVLTAVPRAPPAALVAIDLGCFKPVNDTAGHAAGDAMLKAVAQALRRAASSLTDGAQPITPAPAHALWPLVQPGAVLPPCHTPAPYPMAAACTGYTAPGSHGALSRRQLCSSCEHWLDNHGLA
jgi:hypothetical protein